VLGAINGALTGLTGSDDTDDAPPPGLKVR
jgi:hypothetical protein